MMKPTMTKFGIMLITAVLLAAIACAGAASADGTAPAGPTNVTITKANGNWGYANADVTGAYLIENEADWRYVVSDIAARGAGSPYISATLVLTGDVIFMSDVPSLGSKSHPFTGTIYGNGKKFIYFLQSGSNANGLIAAAGDGCVLNYVQIADSEIDSTATEAGGLIGRIDAADSTGVKLCGCSVALSNVTISDTTGGSTGGFIGRVINSTVEIQASLIDRIYVNSSLSAGGIIGNISRTSRVEIIESRVQESEISGRERVGGVAGTVDDIQAGKMAYLNMTNASVVDAKITAIDKYAGGMVGSLAHYNTIRNSVTFSGYHIPCVENCTVRADDYVGGAIGYNFSFIWNIAFDSYSIQPRVNSTWVYGNTNAGPRYGTPHVDVLLLHYSVWGKTGSSPLSPGVGGNEYLKTSDNYFDGAGTLEEANAAGIGSIIDKEGLTAGVDYGYRGLLNHTVTVLASENGSASATPLFGVRGTQVTFSGTPNPGYHFNESARWMINGTPYATDIYTLSNKNIGVSPNFDENITILNLTGANGVAFDKRTETFGRYNATPVASFPTIAGYNFTGWNVSDNPSVQLINVTGHIQANQPGYTDENGAWINSSLANGAELRLDPVGTVITKQVIPTDNNATFEDNNNTALRTSNTNISKISLQIVSNVSNSPVNFSSDNQSLDSPPNFTPSGSTEYALETELAVFEIEAVVKGDVSSFGITLEFASEEIANQTKMNVYFFHYNTTTGAWDEKPLKVINREQNNATVTYTVETSSFSPFSIGIYKPVIHPQQPPSSTDSGSSGYIKGASQILSNDRTTPTPAPTAVVPTPSETKEVSPIPVSSNPSSKQQTRESPAPIAGIVAGLGIAGIISRLRK